MKKKIITKTISSTENEEDKLNTKHGKKHCSICGNSSRKLTRAGGKLVCLSCLKD